MADRFEDALWKRQREQLVFKELNLSRLISKHKIRFDRGRVYYSYATAFMTAIIVHVLDTVGGWWIYPTVAIVTIILIYAIGYLDQIFGILAKEQERYSNINPFNISLMKKLDDIQNAIKNKQ